MSVVGRGRRRRGGGRAHAALAPDVVLMDMRMPGWTASRRRGGSSRRAARPRVLILTTFDLDEYAFAGLRAGASGFLLKDAPPDRAARGDPRRRQRRRGRRAERHPPAARTLRAPLPGRAAPASRSARLDPLTEREREVLRRSPRGLSNAEIAERLVVAEATVKTHVGRILSKLGLRDRVQAVVFAYETGLVLGLRALSRRRYAAAASAGPCAAIGRVLDRSSVPQTSAPTVRMPAAQVNAVV